MTTLSRAQGNAAIAALDLVAAKNEGNLVNVERILAENDAADLMLGFLLLTSNLRASLAVAWRYRPSELDSFDELIRLMYVDPERVA